MRNREILILKARIILTVRDTYRVYIASRFWYWYKALIFCLNIAQLWQRNNRISRVLRWGRRDRGHQCVLQLRDAEGFSIPVPIPIRGGPHAIFAPLFVSGIVYCQPRFVSREAIPRTPERPLVTLVGPIWPALGELSTGAGNRGVLRARLICISMALLLVDGLPSERTLSFIESDRKEKIAILKFYFLSRGRNHSSSNSKLRIL